MNPAADAHSADELAVGLTATIERELSESDVLDFAQVSGDFNPLHVDPSYAAGTPFEARVVHGAFQVALASGLLGMRLPGLHVLLGSVSARFPSPLFFPSRVVVAGEITAWNPETRGGNLRVVVSEVASGTTTAEITMGFVMRSEGGPDKTAATVRRVVAVAEADRPIVVVTGASGGIGEALVEALMPDHTVLAQVNRASLAEHLSGHPNVVEVRADLTSSNWEDDLAAALADRTLTGVVHAAWPEGPRGGLLEAPDAAIDLQLTFGGTVLVRLARFLAAHVGDGGRLVALGSMAGTQRPSLQMSSYSLGKATLEHAVRLLAPELARKQITINLVSPAFLPVGINKRAEERQLKIAVSGVPLGRLCSTEDVTSSVLYLMSPAASFISGQTLGLYGGQL